MKQRLKDKQIEWLLSITTTHNTWLRRRWNGETITHLLNILSHGEYEIGYEQALLNEIRFEWYREFRKEEVEGLEFLI
jgi:hypothetical protein